ncbi:MAG: hypothetical protein M3381_05115 [Actinomycetota bacterium]|nr:hypothetical protein [Actinomycetota bacterium]
MSGKIRSTTCWCGGGAELVADQGGEAYVCDRDAAHVSDTIWTEVRSTDP